MKTHSISKSSKKLMAILCAVMMLVSCMVFAPASAAEVFSADFETTYPYQETEGGSDNVVKAGGAVYAKQAKDTDGNGVMELYFGAASDVAAFRILSDTEKPASEVGKVYRVSFQYKVVAMPTDMILAFVNNSVNYGSSVYTKFNGHTSPYQIQLNADTTKDTWLDGSFVFTATIANGFHLGLTYLEANKSNIKDAKVLIDNVKIETVDGFEVTFVGNGGTASTSTITTTEDALITATATRPGYTFKGWFTAAKDGEEVKTHSAANTTLYAQWEKVGTYAAIDGLQDFEASADLAMKRFTWVEGEENHTFAGNGALKVAVDAQYSQRSRPRLILQSNGQDLIVEPGKSYTVSFWMRTVKDASCAGYYLATMADNNRDGDIQKEAASAASNGASADVHKLQTLTSISAGTLYNGRDISTDGTGTEVGDMALKAGEWTQVIATFTAEAHVDGKPSYLALGLVSEKNGGVKGCDFYLDDIQVAETDTLNTAHNYESKKVGTYTAGTQFGEGAVAGTGNAREVTDEVMNHSFGLGGDGKTVKVTLKGQEIDDPSNCYATLYDAQGNIASLTPGNTYLLSAWIYSKTAATVGVYARVTGNRGSWMQPEWSKLCGNKTYTLEANTWTQVSLSIVVPTEKPQQDATRSYQFVSMGFANTVADAAEAVYMDDTSVQCIGSLAKVDNNVAVYLKDGQTYYEDKATGTKYGALRLQGGYTIADGDASKAVIGGKTYTVKERGFLFSKTGAGDLSESTAGVVKSSKTKDFNTYWTMDGDVLKYSLLVRKISDKSVDLPMSFRPYIVVADDAGMEYTLYSETVKVTSWRNAAEQGGVDTTWAPKTTENA